MEKKPNFKVGELVSPADKETIFLKGHSTNWSYKLYTITEFIDDTKPTYHIKNMIERYNEALLRKSESTMEKSKNVLKK